MRDATVDGVGFDEGIGRRSTAREVSSSSYLVEWSREGGGVVFSLGGRWGSVLGCGDGWMGWYGSVIYGSY